MHILFKVITLYPDTRIQLDAWCPTLIPLALKGPFACNKNFLFKDLTTYLSSFVQIFDYVPLIVEIS